MRRAHVIEAGQAEGVRNQWASTVGLELGIGIPELVGVAADTQKEAAVFVGLASMHLLTYCLQSAACQNRPFPGCARWFDGRFCLHPLCSTDTTNCADTIRLGSDTVRREEGREGDREADVAVRSLTSTGWALPSQHV